MSAQLTTVSMQSSQVESTQASSYTQTGPRSVRPVRWESSGMGCLQDALLSLVQPVPGLSLAPCCSVLLIFCKCMRRGDLLSACAQRSLCNVHSKQPSSTYCRPFCSVHRRLPSSAFCQRSHPATSASSPTLAPAPKLFFIYFIFRKIDNPKSALKYYEVDAPTSSLRP